MKKPFVLLLLAVLLCVMHSAAFASKPLDEITNYEITVSPRNDGTLDIAYRLEWMVLDDTAEGPLTWVKIGIANEHADELKTQSSSIRSIKLLSDNGQYVRIDLDRAYHAGETVDLQFSLHQKYMLNLKNDTNSCSFSFTPGWFEDIRIQSMKLLWKKGDAFYSNADSEDDSLLIWKASPEPGEKITAIVQYPVDAFEIGSDTETEQKSYIGSDIFAIFGGLIVIILIVVRIRKGGGGYRGGFGTNVRIHAGSSHSCACACGCACACACAGGGRAGCSAKHFYKSNLSVEELQKALHTDKK